LFSFFKNVEKLFSNDRGTTLKVETKQEKVKIAQTCLESAPS
jgi:hypothetical protein